MWLLLHPRLPLQLHRYRRRHYNCQTRCTDPATDYDRNSGDFCLSTHYFTCYFCTNYILGKSCPWPTDDICQSLVRVRGWSAGTVSYCLLVCIKALDNIRSFEHSIHTMSMTEQLSVEVDPLSNLLFTFHTFEFTS